MAAPHFYLKDKKTKEETLISLYCRVAGRRFVYSTNEKVSPVKWSAVKERVLLSHPDAQTINAKLELIRSAFLKEFVRLQAMGFVEFTDLKKAIDITIGKRRGDHTFLNYFDGFIERKKQSPQFKTRSVGSYTSARSLLGDYCKARGKELDFSGVTLDTWRDLENFAIKKGLSNNYIHKLLARIKAVLNDATRRGVNTNTAYKDFNTKVKPEPSTSIYLTIAEVKRLYSIDFSGAAAGKEAARDLFVFGAYTGLRHSDFSTISDKDVRTIGGVELIDKLALKTGKSVVIPLHPVCRVILDKYGGVLPELSQQKTNNYLKQIGKESGFMNDPVNKIITRGGITTAEMVPRWSLFSTHTARRSFATNAYLSGLDVLSIMMITGHTTQAQFLKYIKVTKQENALRIAERFSALF